MSYDYMETILPPEDLPRYKFKLCIVGLKTCPFKLAADDWSCEVAGWPPLSRKQIEWYLTESIGVSTEMAVENNKSVEAENYFKSGFVQTVYSLTTDTGNLVFRALVRHSQNMKDFANPWVVLAPNGPVICGHCTCMGGSKETCSHVAAVLYKIQ